MLIRDGVRVRGSSTRAEKLPALERKGIKAFHLQLKPGGFEGPIVELLDGLQSLVFNIPPGLRREPDSDYVQKIRFLDQALEQSGCPRLIYVSSTAVYGDGQGVVDESTRPEPDTAAGKQLLEAEDLLLSRSQRATLVVRFGGLIGGDRHPVRYLAGREELRGGSDPVNLIHRDDCLRVLRTALDQPQWTGVVNAVHPSHPTKEAYYEQAARKLGLPAPRYRSEDPSGKTINSLHPLLQAQKMLRNIAD